MGYLTELHTHRSQDVLASVLLEPKTTLRDRLPRVESHRGIFRDGSEDLQAF